MPRLSVATNSTPDWSLSELAECAGRIYGLDGIGLWQKRLKEADKHDVRAILSNNGLAVSGIYFAGGFTQGVEKAVEDGRRTIDLAAEFGAPQILFLSGPRRGGQTLTEATKMARDGLEQLAEYGATLEVSVSVEPLHPIMIGKYGFTSTIAQATALMDGIANTTICLDTWNSWWEPNLDSQLDRAASNVGWVHLCDYIDEPKGNPMNRVAVGEGILPFDQQLAPLLAKGFDGWMDLELMQDKKNPRYTADSYEAALQTSVDTTLALIERLTQERAA